MSPSPLLEAEGLRKRYGRREVVRGIDLHIGPGEIVGLLGPNGAGKTTTFRMVMGMIPPDAGCVRLAGRDVTRHPAYRRAQLGTGYLAQEPSIFRKLTVEENLLAILEFREPDRRKRAERARGALREYGLLELAGQKAESLSGGERRRLEIARALLVNPCVMLLDEPFSGVDPIAVSGIRKIIQALKARSLGVLLTDHNVRETLSITDRAYLIKDGAVLEEGPPEKLLQSRTARETYLGEDFTL
jgi:lipopolysaccharide export system ATP-binding protein